MVQDSYIALFNENKNLFLSENPQWYIEKRTEALNILSERELEIISCRYGFNNIVETQRQIAKRLKISRSYVSRIEKRALTKLYLYLTQDKKQ